MKEIIISLNEECKLQGEVVKARGCDERSTHLKAYHMQYHQLESEGSCHQRHLTYGAVSDSQRSMVGLLFN